MEPIKLGPQPGPQTDFFKSSADIVIYGGSAGCGKTAAILLEPLRSVDNPDFNCIIFRRKTTEITTPGGLWDEARKFYMQLPAEMQPRFIGKPDFTIIFNSGAKVKFSHLEYDDTRFDHHGGQYCLIEFDELATFSATQFWYLLSRNRSTCGVRPYVRCTVNPDAGSWVKELIQWWIDDETGYPRFERSGVLRYFTREDDKIKWVSKDWRHPELKIGPKSITFIPGKIDDNKILMNVNPQYKADLLAQNHIDMERLLKGNWNIREDSGMFDKDKIEIIDAPPTDLEWIRYWDRAATQKHERNQNPDETAGAKVAYDTAKGILYVDDVVSFAEGPAENETNLKATADKDRRETTIVLEEEPGSAGKDVIYHYKYHVLKDYVVIADKPSGDKVTRAKTWAGLVEQGKVKFTRGDWNKKALDQIALFPPASKDTKRDIVDAISGAKIHLTQSLKVFSNYRVNHRIKFDPVPGVRMTVLWQEKDMMLYGVCVLWSPINQNLYVYDEFCIATPTAQRLSIEIKQKAAGSKVYGNEPLFGDGSSMAYLLSQGGIQIYENRRYDEAASITVINYMMSRNMVKVHPKCVETDRQFREWLMESNGPRVEKSGCCRALCYIVSELRGEGRLRPAEPPAPYSKAKQMALDQFKRGDMMADQAFRGMDKRYKKKHWMV